ncbi:Z1 domain-containing protein [Parafrankia sp. Ea1.12]|uniref:Z1 domain-containing protein n=1 Tax=Parafrankia sp. Ea1.12 TaxID=573499 RepID=UPI000DA4BD74|nr:Z1 domain-containing protein [Parafrankia sp. Ea1.12]SQE00134.1 Z1 domain-containing protein [Parafrankia sp. Ea1.12]
MTAARPDWADALANALAALSKQGPRPLLTAVSFFTDSYVDESAFIEFLLSIDPNDQALTQLRLTLAFWDHADGRPWLESAPPEAREPRSLGRRAWLVERLGLGAKAAAVIADKVPVYQDRPVVISKVFEPWYTTARLRRSQMYWTDYTDHLRAIRWPAESIVSLDETTTQILERLSDPTQPTARQTKGLVVGYVQSGKTANFTGVIAKAIDSGYRMVIVLTGTIELLRAQTQRRLDMELVGRENVVAGQDLNDPEVLRELDYQQDEDWLAGKFITHGDNLMQSGVAHIQRVTTHGSDYKRLPQGLSRLKFSRVDKAKPLNDPTNLFSTDAYLAVIKKHSSPLRKLIRDLKPLRSAIDDLPILIIDDESDQASVDTTNPAKWRGQDPATRHRTTINKLIAEILQLCPRAQYVGYTATPFANVFIDPDDDSNLFPSNFLLSLHRPPGYMGVADFHDVGKDWGEIERTVATSNELAHVRKLVGDPSTAPERRDQELREAIDSFVLAGAIKLFREANSKSTFKHHTMLVHESVKQRDHRDAADTVRRVWVQGAYRTGGALQRLRGLWERDFSPVCAARSEGQVVPNNFDALKTHIAECVNRIVADGDPVIVVNSDKDIQQNQRRLDFETEPVWRILVGGAQLSRGFTVQGLTVSYFRRRSIQGDTLMQAGRWFGFRGGYRDLVRLYIRRDSQVDLYGAFEALLLDEEAFRDELHQFEGMDDDGLPLLEPWQIPPLVSQHLPWLRPTGRAKMWNAVIDQKGVGGRVSDLYSIPARDNIDDKVHNFNHVAIPLLTAAKGPVELTGFSALVGQISTQHLLRLLSPKEGMRWHRDFTESFSPIMRFFEESANSGKITDWVVVWPLVQKPVGLLSVAGRDMPVVLRTRRLGRTGFVGSDVKHREPLKRLTGWTAGADLEVELARLRTVDAQDRPTTGALLAYLVDDRRRNDQRQPSGDLTDAGAVTILLSYIAPTAAVPKGGAVIRWTVRRSQQKGIAAVSVQGGA